MTAPGPTAWYVYAVLAGTTAPPTCAGAVLPDATLRSIVWNDATGPGLAALVSPVPRALFAADDPLSRAADPNWIAERAEAHHAVVAHAARNGACLPLGFGTIFATEAGVRDWLAAHADGLRRALEEVAGREEWSVSLREDEGPHTAWLDANDGFLRALGQQAATANPGTAFLLAKRLDKARASARAAHGADAAAALSGHLAAVGERVQSEAPRADGGAAWSVLAPPGMGLNDLLSDRAEALRAAGLILRVSGPWPPYAFARAAWQAGHHG